MERFIYLVIKCPIFDNSDLSCLTSYQKILSLGSLECPHLIKFNLTHYELQNCHHTSNECWLFKFFPYIRCCKSKNLKKNWNMICYFPWKTNIKNLSTALNWQQPHSIITFQTNISENSIKNSWIDFLESFWPSKYQTENDNLYFIWQEKYHFINCWN